MKNKKIEILIIAIAIIIQTIIYVFVGMNKSYLHLDEAYSFGLTNYDKIEISDNEDFFNTWHNSEYYEDYLSIQEDEIWDYTPVYENQKNDVHPPFYYLLLRFMMSFTIGYFSKWPGIILNIILYSFITIFMYLILKRLFANEKYTKEKSITLAFMSSIILASISNVIYIRMYALSTLNILITLFLHIKLLESQKVDFKILFGIGIIALIGVLTHYYYLFFLLVLYIIFLVKYIREKKINFLVYYTFTMLIAGLVSLIIFPYSINHMFFGYRGQGVIDNLKNITVSIKNIAAQIYNLNYYVFNNLMILIITVIIGIIIYNKIHKKMQLQISNKQVLKIIYLPTIFFFIIASIASPWNVLRFIVPVCGLIFILVIYYLYKLLQTILNEKITNIFIAILFCMILISPFVFKLEPELLYSDKKEMLEQLENEYNLPAIYLYYTGTSGFLDDILIFTKLDETYIAKDIECTEDNIKEILENKDISNGIILIIDDEQDSESIVSSVKEFLNFNNSQELDSGVSCKIYCVY